MYVRLNKDLESVLLNDDHVHKKHLSYEQKVREQEKERQLDGHLADLPPRTKGSTSCRRNRGARRD